MFAHCLVSASLIVGCSLILLSLHSLGRITTCQAVRYISLARGCRFHPLRLTAYSLLATIRLHFTLRYKVLCAIEYNCLSFNPFAT